MMSACHSVPSDSRYDTSHERNSKAMAVPVGPCRCPMPQPHLRARRIAASATTIPTPTAAPTSSIGLLPRCARASPTGTASGPTGGGDPSAGAADAGGSVPGGYHLPLATWSQPPNHSTSSSAEFAEFAEASAPRTLQPRPPHAARCVASASDAAHTCLEEYDCGASESGVRSADDCSGRRRGGGTVTGPPDRPYASRRSLRARRRQRGRAEMRRDAPRCAEMRRDAPRCAEMRRIAPEEVFDVRLHQRRECL